MQCGALGSVHGCWVNNLGLRESELLILLLVMLLHKLVKELLLQRSVPAPNSRIWVGKPLALRASKTGNGVDDRRLPHDFGR